MLSSRPELVSGGDALVRLTLPRGSKPNKLRVLRNGQDVTAQLAADPKGGALVGVISGLSNGANVVSVVYDRRTEDRLTLTNYPKWGPMISGPHEQPFYCRTDAFTTNLPAGTNLGPRLDANFSVATRAHYLYRTTANTFAQLPNPALRPADLAYTTTNAGKTVPYVVRLETGTINRAIYQTAILHDPLTEAAPSLPWRPRPVGTAN